MNPPRPRVLLIAEAANPEWVSVPLEGYSHSQAITKVVDAHVVTHIRNRDAWLRAGHREGVDFTVIDSDAVARPLYLMANVLRSGAGKGWTTVTAFQTISYYYFEHLLWKRFGQDVAKGVYDVVHRITPLSPTAPSLLARRCQKAGVPFVLGPLNGGVPWPKGFDSRRRAEREWLSYIRNAYKLMPGYRSTRRHSAAILVGSSDTLKQMDARHHDACVYIPENGIDPARFTARRSRTAALPLRLGFVGRLVPYKGADMLIEAIAPLVRSGKVTLSVIGDGPQQDELVKLTQQHGCREGIRFLGRIPHTELQSHLIELDMLVLPSIREFGGAVALEAMAVGVVPMVVKYGGPAELVTPACGYPIPLSDRVGIIASINRTLTELIDNPQDLDAKSAHALRRAHACFTWDAKAQMVSAVYDWVLGRRPDKPQFEIPLPDPDESSASDASDDLRDSSSGSDPHAAPIHVRTSKS